MNMQKDIHELNLKYQKLERLDEKLSLLETKVDKLGDNVSALSNNVNQRLGEDLKFHSVRVDRTFYFLMAGAMTVVEKSYRSKTRSSYGSHHDYFLKKIFMRA